MNKEEKILMKSYKEFCKYDSFIFDKQREFIHKFLNMNLILMVFCSVMGLVLKNTLLLSLGFGTIITGLLFLFIDFRFLKVWERNLKILGEKMK